MGERIRPQGNGKKPPISIESLRRTHGKERKIALGKELVQFCLEKQYDCLHALQAVNIGLSFIFSGGQEKDVGKVIIGEIEEFFNRARICHKVIIPFDSKNLKEDFDNVKTAATHATKRLEALEKRNVPLPPAIADFLLSLTNALYSIERQGQKSSLSSINIIPQRGLLRDKPSYQEIQYAYAYIFKAIYQTKNLDFLDHRNLTAAEDILAVIQQTFHNSPLLPEAYMYKHSQDEKSQAVSLQDLAETPNSQDFIKKAFIYLSHIPKGDFFWERLKDTLFFSSGQPETQDAPLDKIFSNLLFSQNISLFQQVVAEKLLLPAFLPETHDPEFDQWFRDILTTSDIVTIHDIAIMILNRSLFGPSFGNMFSQDQEISFSEIIQKYPLNRLAFQANRHKFMLCDTDTHEFLLQHKDRVFHDLDTRFSDYPPWNICRQTLRKLFDTNPQETYSKIFLEHILGFLGTNFIEKLNEKPENLRQITQRAMDKMALSDIGYFPSPHIEHRIIFSEGSIPEIMGLRFIMFIGSDSEASTFEFLVKTGFHADFRGAIHLKEKTISLSIELDKEQEGLKTLLETVIIMTFHDLLIREDIVRQKKPRFLTQKIPDGKQKRGPQATKLPRRRSIQSDRLVEEIVSDRMQKGFTPRFIDSYKMTLRGARHFEETLKKTREYQSQGIPIPPDLIEELNQSRQNLYRPNPKKAAHLPPRFKLRAIQDIDGSDVYLETWVQSHSSPKLTEEEQKSLFLTFIKRYEESGSSFAFLNELRPWIFGEERQ